MVHERSAGGVVYCNRASGVYALLIRDRYGRWTLPKGGIEPGETPQQAALREILEETGIEGEVESRIGETAYWYNDPSGRAVHKVVEYYLVKALTHEISAAVGEIDQAKWVALNDAAKYHGYPNNDEILVRAVEILSQKAPGD